MSRTSTFQSRRSITVRAQCERRIAALAKARGWTTSMLLEKLIAKNIGGPSAEEVVSYEQEISRRKQNWEKTQTETAKVEVPAQPAPSEPIEDSPEIGRERWERDRKGPSQPIPHLQPKPIQAKKAEAETETADELQGYIPPNLLL